MKRLRYTLLPDGSSDRGLLPILTWLLEQNLPARAIVAGWADLRRVISPQHSLAERIGMAIKVRPCDLLFVHRDAERASRTARVNEIRRAQVQSTHPQFPAVCVVPVRMTEAWLLFDDAAIRRAAGNPHGRIELELPAFRTVEGIPDPKALLHALLIRASELGRRRGKTFPVRVAAARLAELIPDFAPLRQLTAFSALEQDLQQTIHERGW